MKAGRLPMLALPALLLMGCSLDRMAADQMVPVLRRTKELTNRETIPRAAREAAPALLATLDGLVATSPENADLQLLKAELAAGFAFAFLEDEDPAWARAMYRKARAAALAALAEADEDLTAALTADTPAGIGPALAEAGEDCLPALFWWGFARGAEINLDRGDPAQLADLARVDPVMEWVLARDEGFYHGGPQLYFALRRAALSPSMGGDPVAAARHFEAVERITGGKMLLARVLRAQYLAPSLAATPAGAGAEEALEAQRRAWAAYHDPLAAVVAAPADLWPEQALQNAVARERARKLLADPEAHGVMTPPGVVNEFARPDDGTAWGNDDDGGWDEDGR